LDESRAIQTFDNILWHVQLTHNLSAHDGYSILQINHDREDCDLYG